MISIGSRGKIRLLSYSPNRVTMPFFPSTKREEPQFLPPPLTLPPSAVPREFIQPPTHCPLTQTQHSSKTYEVLDFLSKGSFGQVMLVEEVTSDEQKQKTGKLFALKWLNPGGANMTRRTLAREVQAMSIMKHPNIVSLYDKFTEALVPQSKMEQVQISSFQQLKTATTPSTTAITTTPASSPCLSPMISAAIASSNSTPLMASLTKTTSDNNINSPTPLSPSSVIVPSPPVSNTCLSASLMTQSMMSGTFRVGLIMEFCPNRTLRNLLPMLAHRIMPERVLLAMIRQVALGLQLMHSKDYVHRDIKPHNLLISESGDVKIADFGLAKKVNFTKFSCDTFSGTPGYISPECAHQQPFSFSADAWGLGATILELATGVPMRARFKREGQPIYAVSDDIKDTWLVELKTRNYSDKVQSVLCSLLIADPDSRASMDSLLAMDVMKEAAEYECEMREYMKTAAREAKSYVDDIDDDTQAGTTLEA